jgi:hypothetical protein
MKKLTRILFVSDIHGSTPVFLKALSAANAYKAQALIHGGDILGKYMIPFYKKGNQIETEILGTKRVFSGENEAHSAETDVARIGAYSLLITPEDWGELVANTEKMSAVFYDLAAKRLESWVALAEEKMRPLGIKIFLNIGNDDFQKAGSVIEESDYVQYPNNKVMPLDDDHEMLSLGNANMTPWKCEGDLEEDELFKMLDSLASKLHDPRRSIFNLHCPPINTKLDVAPLLDDQLRPIYLPGGDPRMAHVGSTAVRSVIEKFRPLAGLHGHIHEAKAVDRIGKTQLYNPGSEYTTGLLDVVLLNLSPDKVESFMFLTA